MDTARTQMVELGADRRRRLDHPAAHLDNLVEDLDALAGILEACRWHGIDLMAQPLDEVDDLLVGERLCELGARLADAVPRRPLRAHPTPRGPPTQEARIPCCSSDENRPTGVPPETPVAVAIEGSLLRLVLVGEPPELHQLATAQAAERGKLGLGPAAAFPRHRLTQGQVAAPGVIGFERWRLIADLVGPEVARGHQERIAGGAHRASMAPRTTARRTVSA